MDGASATPSSRHLLALPNTAEFIEQAPVGILVLQDGRAAYANGYLLEITGYERKEFIGMEIARLIHADDVPWAMERVRARLEGERVIRGSTLRYVRKDGEVRWLEASGAKIQWDDRPALVYFLYDVTERKTVEAQLVQTQDVTISALAYQAELRDQQTGQHLERVSIYVRMLAEQLTRLPQYHQYLTPDYIDALVKSAPLHDIGKVGIPDAILLKPAKLTAEEMEVMKRHCEYGARILRRAEQKLSFRSFLTLAIQLAMYHHERWNGAGYPEGLRDEQIPLSARIMAVADNYDAMRMERVYKRAFSHEECLTTIKDLSGQFFDPNMVNAFVDRQGDFENISTELAD